MRTFINKIVVGLATKGVFNFLPDKEYLKLLFWGRMGRKLNLKSPSTYNEILQWIKLYDRNPIYTLAVDKSAVKGFISDLVGKQYTIPTIGEWDSFDEINFDDMPNAFVLKCTHNSGGLVICRDKGKMDMCEVKRKISNSLKSNYYSWGREWPYKNVKPKIIAEELIGENDRLPVDYKFFCFGGVIDSVMLCLDRDFGRPKFVFYDIEWNRLRYQTDEPILDKEIEKPENFEEMIMVVKKIAAKFKCPRVDMYNVDGKIYFGEITFFNQSGFDKDISYETDLMWGNKVKLCLEESIDTP